LNLGDQDSRREALVLWEFLFLERLAGEGEEKAGRRVLLKRRRRKQIVTRRQTPPCELESR
jgi:hypothetical protein